MRCVVRALIVAGGLLSWSTTTPGQATSRSVVLPARGVREIAKRGTWQPCTADVAGVEAKLKQISNLKAENRRAVGDVHIDHPEQYSRQYIGITHRGKKLIYVNAFCADIPAPTDWRERLVFVYDGGTCYWHALYDPNARKFLSLWVNGE